MQSTCVHQLDNCHYIVEAKTKTELKIHWSLLPMSIKPTLVQSINIKRPVPENVSGIMTGVISWHISGKDFFEITCYMSLLSGAICVSCLLQCSMIINYLSLAFLLWFKVTIFTAVQRWGWLLSWTVLLTFSVVRNADSSSFPQEPVSVHRQGTRWDPLTEKLREMFGCFSYPVLDTKLNHLCRLVCGLFEVSPLEFGRGNFIVVFLI